MDKIFRKHMNALRNEVRAYLTSYVTASAARDSARADHAKAVDDLKKFFGPEEVRLRMELIERGAKIAEREKEDAFFKVRKARFSLLDRAQEIRGQLRAELETASLADPAAVDANVCRLLDSGILTSADFKSIYDNASTPTMRRMIGAAAGKAAEATESAADREVLNGISHDSKNIIRDEMATFDRAVSALTYGIGTVESGRNECIKTVQAWVEMTE